MNKELLNLKKKIEKAKELIQKSKNNNLDFKLIKLTKLKFETVEAETVKFESKVENLGRLRGIRKPSIVKSEITFDEFIELELKELKIPITDIETSKEKILNYLKEQNEEETIKICEANLKIKELIDPEYGKECKKERETIEILIGEIADLAAEIDCNEYDDEATKEIEDIIQEIIRYLD